MVLLISCSLVPHSEFSYRFFPEGANRLQPAKCRVERAVPVLHVAVVIFYKKCLVSKIVDVDKLAN